MNHKEYLELLTEDLNTLFSKEQTSDSAPKRETEHSFRVKVLVFHLHADYLLSEIIKGKFQGNLSLTQNKENFNTNNMGFIEKLRIIYSTGNFEEGLFTTLRILNNVRNKLSHNLIIDLTEEEQRIRTLKISSIIVGEDISKITTLEHLLYGTLTDILILAEYLYQDVLGEELKWMLGVQIPRVGVAPEKYPILSVVPITEMGEII